MFVDYAHTACALSRVLASLKEVVKETGGRRIVVFGCGGDRDRSKRPAMGTVACDGADVVVLTSDNPRTEDPHAIISDVLEGIPHGRSGFTVEVDRARAIRHALTEARAGDVVLIAGKGHEDYQIIGSRKIPFDDRDVARRILEEFHRGSVYA